VFAQSHAGFLPGYHRPSSSVPLYAQKAAGQGMAPRDRPLVYRPGSGFYGGRYNGGSFGPCWTRTLIGPI